MHWRGSAARVNHSTSLQKEQHMTEFSLDRRQMLGAAVTAAALAPAMAGAQSVIVGAAPAAASIYNPVPLPFDPKTITGMSEKLILSHHGNNYTGTVKRLGSVIGELGKLDLAKAPGFTVNGLKREELIAQNSMVFHEIYFSCIGAPNQPSAPLASAIERDFGSFAKWALEFSAMGKALAGGSGWVVLNWMERDKKLINGWANDHTMALVGGTPVMVMDMYEHAYAIDYGSKAAAYVDAFMATINWAAADKRFVKASA
jgi:superoxide dismutase, Fe-Mn family